MNHSARLFCLLVCLLGSLIRSSAGWFNFGHAADGGGGGDEQEGFDLRSQLDELASSQHYLSNLQDPGLARDMLKVFNLKCLKTKIADELAALGATEFQCLQERAAAALRTLNSTDFECLRDRSIDLMSKMDEKCYKRKMLEQLSSSSSSTFKPYKFLTVMLECFEPAALGLLKYDCFGKLKSEAVDMLLGCVKRTKAPIMNVFIDCMDFHDGDEETAEEEESHKGEEAQVAPKISYAALEPSRFKTPSCANNSNCQDVNTWDSYCCDDLRKCCDLLKYTFKDSNRLYNFLVVYREPRTVYSTVMYGLPVVTLFIIGCVGILLSDLYSFCHYLFCRRCIDCLLKRRRRKRTTNDKYFEISRDASQNGLLDSGPKEQTSPISNV